MKNNFSIPRLISHGMARISSKAKFLLILSGLFITSITTATTNKTELVQSTITGTVIDADGIPLAGANVIVKGTTNGTQTDFDGNYSIEALSDATLIYSYVGFTAQEVAVNGRSTINITLAGDASQLEEVVVLGYSTQTRGDLTGSVGSVDLSEALKAPIVNAAEALEGRVTGVTVINNSTPGSAPKINIRGFGSSNNTNPLFIIDGVQTDDPNALNNLNPGDIDQMNVLKDGAAAIYGARASNGVVVITTKSGSYNMAGAKMTLDMYTGFSQIANTPDLLNTQQHADVLWQSQINDGIAPSHGQYGSGASPVIPNSIIDYKRVVSYEPEIELGNFNAPVTSGGTDWIDAITQTAPISSIAFSLSNGSETGKYFMSVGYLSRDGILNHTGFERISTKLNSEFKLGDRVKIGEHANISFTNTNAGITGESATSDITAMGSSEAIENALRMSPLTPLRDETGLFAGVNAPGLGNTRNPEAQLYRARNNYNKRYAVFGDVYLSYAILDELTFKTTLAGGYSTFDRRAFTALDPEHGEPISANSLIEQDDTAYNWSWTNTLNYNKTFGDHSINALVGVEAVKDGGKGKRISNSDYLFEDPTFYLISTGRGTPNADAAYEFYNTLYSLFGTANYSYKDRYFATATLRRDETSRFIGDNKSGVFPSFSGGWVISNEEFYPGDAIVNRVKLRGSWGKLGNQTITSGNPTINISNLDINQANYAYNGSTITSGAILSAVGNPDIKWETTVSTNVGIDLDLFNNKLNLSLEGYIIETEDLLTPGQLGTTGPDALPPFVNLGDIKNTGIDFSIGYNNETDSGFAYGITANLSHYKNEVTKLNSEFQPGRDDLRNGVITRTTVGDELSYFYGLEIIGFTDTGRFDFKDVNGDGEITSDDRTKIGSPHPDFTYGLNLNASYKGFDTQLFFTGSQGNEIYNYNKVFTDFGLFFNGNRSTRVLDSWTPTNTNATLPALTASAVTEEASPNSYFVEDGSYFRLKNVQLGYSLPESLIDKLGIGSIRLYVQATNLFTLTKYEGFDPEIISNDNLSLGIDSRIYPNAKVYTMGVNVKF